MKDDLDQNIIKQINQNTYDQIAALRILRVGSLLKADLLTKFWDFGEEFIQKKLQANGNSYWRLERSEYSVLDPQFSIRILNKNINQSKPHPSFWFHQFTSSTIFRWELGVKFNSWLEKGDKISSSPEAIKFRALLEGYSMPPKYRWDGYKPITEDDSKGIERTLEEECVDKRFSKALFEDGWETFKLVEPGLKRLSNAVMRMA